MEKMTTKVTAKNVGEEFIPSSKEQKEEQRKQNEIALRKEWEKDREMVKGIFRFHECPRGEMSFFFHKYKWDKGMTYRLKDGEIYEIPRSVAKHLNTNVAYNSYKYENNMNGLPVVSMSEKVRRTSFQSLDYIDMEDPAIKSKMNNFSSGTNRSLPVSALPI